MAEKINNLALGYAVAIFSAAHMLLLGILGTLGVLTTAVQAMQQWHIFFSLSFWGIVAGIIEGAIIGFVIAYVFGWVYNKFV